jgi:DNA-binding response OmpR family regulator
MVGPRKWLQLRVQSAILKRTLLQIVAMALRILFVEDHTYSRQTVSRLLKHFHYDVVAAPDYRTASTLLDKWQFDVLLSDIRLPDGDGCNLVTVAKSKQPLVAIALTGLGTAKDEKRGLSCGFDHYFVKPLEFYRLRAILRGTVSRHR